MPSLSEKRPVETKLSVYRADSFDELTHPEYRGRAALVIADPPYGKILKEDWDDIAQYNRITGLLEDVLMPGGTAYVWGGIGRPGYRPFLRWLSTFEAGSAELVLHNLITWSKRRAYGKADNYLFTREECAMIVKGEKPKTFNIPLLDTLRGYAGYNEKYPAKSEYLRRTNVWTDITEIFKGKIHPAEKPSKLAEIMIRTSSNPGDFIIDPFAGSGSTGVAALAVGGRRCLLIEKSDCAMHPEVADFEKRRSPSPLSLSR